MSSSSPLSAPLALATPARLALAVALALGGSVALSAAHAQQPPQPSAPTPSQTVDTDAAELPPVQLDYRGERLADPRVARDLQEIPRVITVLPADLLEQRATTELRQALRSVTGISLQAGEGNPAGGDMLKIRGFNARDDLNVNGVRDRAPYFRDPFYVEQIEVIKGPNSTFGGRGSSGGTINLVTKRPLQENRGRIEASVGTDSFFRSTVDLNRAIDDNQAFRINLMGHSEDVPGRDVVDQRRYGFFGAYTWGFQSDTQITADYLHVRQNNTPDYGLPFDRQPAGPQGTGTGRIAPVRFSNYYGHTDDYEHVDVDQVGLTVDHAFNDDVQLRNATRYGRTHVDRIISAPRFTLNTPGTFEDGATVVGNTKPRDQRDTIVANQTDLLVHLETGPVTHDLVFGVEVYRDETTNRTRPDQNGPATDLFNPERRTRPAHAYDGRERSLEIRGTGVYAMNTMALSEQFDVHAGIRHDRVRATASQTVEPGSAAEAAGQVDQSFTRRDSEWSYNVGLVYKPQANTALFANYGSAFEPSASFDRNVVQPAGGIGSQLVNPDFFDADPQRSTAFEIGAKHTVLGGLDLGVAAFRTIKRNARLPNSLPSDNNPPSRQRVQGIEFTAAGSLTDTWRLWASYTYMRSRVLSAPPGGEFFVGQELGGVPRHSFSLFTDYDITPRFSVGGGVQYVGKTVNNVVNQGQVLGRNDAYTVVDLSATYRIDRNSQVRLNVLNAFDERYISQAAEGSAQGIPGPGRRFMVTYRYDF